MHLRLIPDVHALSLSPHSPLTDCPYPTSSDFRYMATSDLLHELSKDSFRAAPEVEKKVVAVVLTQLDDQSGDVSTLAVKCLPPLVRGCSLPSVVAVMDGLLQRVCFVNGKDAEIRAKRDAGVIGLRTIIAEVPHTQQHHVSQIVTALVPKLLTKLNDSINTGEISKNTGVAGDLAGDCLELITALSAKHGSYMTGGEVVGVTSQSEKKTQTEGDISPSDSPSQTTAPQGVSPATAQALEQALQRYLKESGRQATRKRAAACLASLGASASDGFLSRCAAAARTAIASAIERKLPAQQRDELCAPYAHLLGSMAHASGSRFGPHADDCFATIFELTETAHEEGSETLRETCLRTVERFIGECPRSVAGNLPKVVAKSLELIAHDPLYGDEGEGDADGDDAMDDDADDADFSEYGSEYDASEYSDDGDDDQSWKIRRGAARVLSAVATNAPNVLEQQFETVVKKLLRRGSKERDEQCRLEVFGTLEAVLRAASARKGASNNLVSLVESVALDIAVAAAKWSADSISKKDKELGVKSTLKIRTNAFHVLTELITGVPNALVGDGVFPIIADSLAATLNATAGSGTVNGTENNGTCTASQPTSSDSAGTSEVRVAALVFARVAAETHSPSEIYENLQTLAPPLCAAMNDRYYKTAAEATRASEALVRVFVEGCGGRGGTASDKIIQLATLLATQVGQSVSTLDRDAEVKTASISCAGAVCASLGQIASETSILAVMEGLYDRLGNEATRVNAANALATVFASQNASRSAVQFIAKKSADILVTFLRKSDRALRHGSLDALLALVKLNNEDNDSSSLLLDSQIASVLENSAGCVVDSEPVAAAAALRTASAALLKSGALPVAAEAARVHTLTAALSLCASGRYSRRGGKNVSNLRSSLRNFFGDLITAQLPGASHSEVREALFEKCVKSNTSSSKDVGVAVAECVASACVSSGGDAVVSTAKGLVDSLHDSKTDPERQRLAMYCLGELGKVGSAFADAAVADKFEHAVRAAFDATAVGSDESLTAAAAYALGGACAGTEHRARFLPTTLGGLDGDGADDTDADSAKSRYAFLLSLKAAIEAVESRDEEINERTENDGLSGSLHLSTADSALVVDSLRQRSEQETEEGARVVLAECLGRLAAWSPKTLLPQLEQDATSDASDVHQKVVAVLAAKHAVLAALASRNGDTVRSVTERLPFFVGNATLSSTAHAEVCVAAMKVLSAAAHGIPSIVVSGKKWIAEVTDLLFLQTPIDQSLVRVVDLGPFKHTVDDGLETRKAAFECVSTVLDAFSVAVGNAGDLSSDSSSDDFLQSAPSSFATGVASAIATGSGDHYDVKIVSHALISKLTRSPLGCDAVAEKLPTITSAMTKTLTQKMKSDAVKQEIDRNFDLLRSCLKAVVHLSTRVSTCAENEAWNEFMAKTVKGEKTAGLFEEAKKSILESGE